MVGRVADDEDEPTLLAGGEAHQPSRMVQPSEDAMAAGRGWNHAFSCLIGLMCPLTQSLEISGKSCPMPGYERGVKSRSVKLNGAGRSRSAPKWTRMSSR